MANNHHEKSLFDRIGCEISSWVSDLAAHPLAQIGVILVCAAWFAIGFATELLTAILSILAITLTQMVLNRQNEREADAHRRDVAMHTKIDELLASMKGARNDFVGIEELDEEDIEELKEEVRDAIDDAGVAATDEAGRTAVKEAVTRAVHREVEEAKTTKRAKSGKAQPAKR